MKRIISILAVAAMTTGAAMAQTNGDFYDDYPDNNNGIYPDSTYVEPVAKPPMPATCELDTGFGLIAIATDQAMFDEIQAKLAAGEYVGINVDNLDITNVLTEGGYRVIGAVIGHGGMLAICYQTF